MKTLHKIKITIALIVLAAICFVFAKLPINLGLDLQGGTRLVLEAKDTKKVKATNDAILGALAVIRNRVDGLGVSEPIIRRKGIKQIVVELSGIKNPERAVKLIGETALLEFVAAEWAPPNIDKLSKEKREILTGKDAKIEKYIEYDNSGNIIRERPIILKQTVLTGADLKVVQPGNDENANPVVNIEFKSDATTVFHNITKTQVGKPIAILLDNKIISAPNVSEPIAGGRAQISGRFTIQEMRELVIKLKAGALPIPVEIISKKIIGPTLGRDSIEKSKKAGMIGLSIVCVFMILIYRLPGFFASISLLIYISMVFACLKIFQATLTLPGIAGLILTIGMAVDANVLIFERIHEEKKAGQPLKPAIANGFAQAFRTILDANITTLIAAAVLFWLGSGPIRGFAVTLSIGILTSMFTAIFITRLLIDGAAVIAKNKEFLFYKN